MILCCGEALIDMLPREGSGGATHYLPACGGAVFNTAIALGRLGVPTGFFTGLSTDFFGDLLKAALVESEVDISRVRFSARPSTLAFVKLSNGQASYAFFDENSAGRMLAVSDLPLLGAEMQALHFSCISLIPEPCGSTYEALMAREHRDRVIMLDPNIRAAFVEDKAGHLQRMRRMIAMADIVKLSDEDLAWFGETGTHDEIASRWLAMGPKLVVMTAGAKGATGWTAHGKVGVPSRRVTVVDTVGAGDTFNAGILAALHDGGLLSKRGVANLGLADVERALSVAASVAAVTVSRAGANPPWRRELDDSIM
jgi:fructokinase